MRSATGSRHGSGRTIILTTRKEIDLFFMSPAELLLLGFRCTFYPEQSEWHSYTFGNSIQLGTRNPHSSLTDTNKG